MTPIDSLRAEVAALRAELAALKAQAVAPQWTLTSRSSAMGAADQVQTADDDKNRGQRPVSRLEPFGLRYRAPSKLRSFSLRIGTSNVVFIGIQPSKGYGPTDVDDGEVALYNITKAIVRLWKSGKVTLDADSGQDVVVNGGTAKVARVGDTLTASAQLAAWASVIESFCNGIAPGTFTPLNQFAPAASPPPGAANPGADGNLGTIQTGADHLKG